MKGYHWHAWDLALLDEAMMCSGLVVEELAVVDHWHQFVVARLDESADEVYV